MKEITAIACMLWILLCAGSLNAQEVTPLYLDETKALDIRVDDALMRMTLEEKVALIHAQSLFSNKGVPRLGIPELCLSDGPHGIRAELSWNSFKMAGWTNDSCTAFPALTCLAATWNPYMSYMYGKAIGEEARYRKKDVLLAPGVNIYRTPLNGRNFEYPGEDPFLSSKMVVPYIKGVQENGVAACVKHYVLNNQEICRGFINVQLSDRSLHEIYLPAFKAAVREGDVMAVMAAYNKYQGEWCTENSILLDQILKTDWQFNGVVISDWNAVHSTMGAASNGLDMEMGTNPGPGKTFDDYFLARPYLEALKAGKASMDKLDDKARRILYLTFKTAMNRNRPWGSFASEDHALVARKIAEEGIVLLKNRKETLPLDLSSVKSIAVIGENATRKMTVGGGSSELKAIREISPLEGLNTKLGNEIDIYFAQGYSHTGNADQLLASALEIAERSDIVLFFGGLNKDKYQDCEGMDRQEYNLPFGQDKLIEEITKVNQNVVVILISGNAVAMPWVNNVNAIIQAWYCGSEAGNAIANILTGETNPSGKLPFTINKQLNDYGPHFYIDGYPGDSVNVNYKEDILLGYRWNDTKNIEPQFCFGHGLSYTSFNYGKAKGDKIKLMSGDVIDISVPVKNLGSMKGAEVVQLYINDLESSVLRPEKELKGFSKIVLLPGEEQTIHFEIRESDLQYYDDSKHKWYAEPGKFEVSIGSSSRDIRTSIVIEYSE